MAYVYSRLNGQSQTHLQSWLKNGALKFASMADMMKILETLFDDPNRARDAAARLHSNYQRNRPFISWIAEIRRDATMAGYEPESLVLRNIIFFNMSMGLKRAIIHEHDLNSLPINKVIARLQDIDSHHRSLTALLSRNNNNFPGRPQPAPHSQPQSTQGDSMDLSTAEIQRRGPLSQEEKDRRRRLGLCSYCGEKGHYVKFCPTRPSLVARVVETEGEHEVLSGKE